ncbi:MAG TPA: phosphoenolpyruvate carboxykinase (ATP) [Chryseolinea sp.]|nr:phosphoenolpyruvate carboxykinase (ATP) [Chryseolinea sp.]
MLTQVITTPVRNLSLSGIKNTENVRYQLSPDELIQDTLRLGEGVLSDSGALVIRTGEFTGRSPKDKFIVKDQITESTIHWNDVNQPIDQKYFDIIHGKITEYFESLPELWVRDCYACADPRFRLKVRVITAKPCDNLFAYNMFLRPGDEELENFLPDWHVISAPDLKLDPAVCGTRQHNAAVVSFKHKMILIAGTAYTGEIKKGIFTILNYLLPQEQNVLSMHCSANIGEKGDTAIFFGLSGTGKTTLSADPDRKLIGDDEHGWSADNIFNFEGGCYAKTINLTEEKEPEIFNAIKPGAILENVIFYPGSNSVNFDDGSITENTRVSYPIDYISNAIEPSIGGLPKNIFFLTCDAFGVLPPIAKLTPGQAMYQFISGYTAKVAGTEAGIKEPKPTFSACFGAPFLPLHPGKYAKMLGDKMQEHKVNVWMVNTGWTGGPYGIGTRMKLKYTRAMISAVLEGQLNSVAFQADSVFGMSVPLECPNVPADILNPRNTWSDKSEYDAKARFLANLFIKNFDKYKDGATAEVLAGAPTI